MDRHPVSRLGDHKLLFNGVEGPSVYMLLLLVNE